MSAEPGAYSFLETPSPPGGCQRILSYPRLPGIRSWMLGAPFSAPPAEPIELEWDPDSRGERKAIYDISIPLYHRDVLAALDEAGVDNLDTYAVRIRDRALDECCEDYRAVNVIGLVAAADLEQSSHSDPGGRGLVSIDFDGVHIDPAKAHGLRMFRLAECVSGVLVSAPVRVRLEAGRFGLRFVAPSQWIG